MTIAVEHREFIPGTTGWTVDDLDDPEIEKLWFQGRYEIVEGVLTTMAPAVFDGGSALGELIFILRSHIEAMKLGGRVAPEVDLILGRHRLPVVDVIYLSTDDLKKQKRAHAATGKRKQWKYGRIMIPPTLIIESLSPGHEAHDRETKRRWYAEAGVPNYWMLDALQRTLECLILEGGDYRIDQSGKDDAELRPGMFPGLVIPLGKIWAE
jgi:Uma2 family endonuclease